MQTQFKMSRNELGNLAGSKLEFVIVYTAYSGSPTNDYHLPGYLTIFPQSSPLSVDSLWRRVVNSALPISVFALKLIEWWYSTERSAAVRMMTSLPIPPPPSHTQVGGVVCFFTCYKRSKSCITGSHVLD